MIFIDGQLTRVDTKVWEQLALQTNYIGSLIRRAQTANHLGEIALGAAFSLPAWTQRIDTSVAVQAAIRRANDALLQAQQTTRRLADGAAHAAAVFARAEGNVDALFRGLRTLTPFPWRRQSALLLALGTYATMNNLEVRADHLAFHAAIVNGGEPNSETLAKAFALGGQAADQLCHPETFYQARVLDMQSGQSYWVDLAEDTPLEVLFQHPLPVIAGGLKRLSELFGAGNTRTEQENYRLLDSTSQQLKVAARFESKPRELATPHRVEQLITGLSKLDSTNKHGHVQVLKHESKDAFGQPQVSWTVNIRGTQTWDLGGSHPQNLAANLQQVAGMANMQERIVVQAMSAAGIKPGEPVELVGHSQGGIAAARIASDPVVRQQYRIVDVVTFGSPNSHIPSGNNTLRVEGSFDPVPVLDGQQHAAEGITVTSPTRAEVNGELKHPHAQETYAAIAAEIDASPNADLVRWREQRARDLGLNSTTRTTAYDFLSVQTHTPLTQR